MILGIINNKIYIRFYTNEVPIFQYIISIYQIKLVENGIQFIHNIGLETEPILEGIEIGWKRNPKRRQFVDLFIIIIDNNQYTVYNKCTYNTFEDLNKCKSEYRKILKEKEELIEMIKKTNEIEIEIIEDEKKEGDEEEDIEISLLSISSDKEISLEESEEENNRMSIDSNSEND